MRSMRALGSPKAIEVITVLIVDDAPLVRERLAGALQDFARVTVLGKYDSAQAAIDGVMEHEPDLVVLDIELKGSNGMQVLRHVVDNHYPAKVFIFSNDNDPQQRRRFLQAGADGFYSKAGEFDQMLDTIDAFAAAR